MLLLLKTSLWKKTMQTWNKLAEWQSPLLKWTLIITVEQVHSYPLPGRMKGGIKWSHLLLTTEVKRQFAHGMLCVWHILCSAFSLVSQWQGRVPSQLAVPTELCISSRDGSPDFSTTALPPTMCSLGLSLLGMVSCERSCGAGTKSTKAVADLFYNVTLILKVPLTFHLEFLFC